MYISYKGGGDRKETRAIHWSLILAILVVSFSMLFLIVYSAMTQGMFKMLCPGYHGKGFIAKISRISLNGESGIIRKDNYWRITATFYNEGERNVSVLVHAYIEYEGEIFDEKTIPSNFPSSAYTTVTLDLHASTTHTTGTYDVSVPSDNRVILCPECDGKGYVTNWDAIKLVSIASLAIINIILLLLFPSVILWPKTEALGGRGLN